MWSGESVSVVWPQWIKYSVGFKIQDVLLFRCWTILGYCYAPCRRASTNKLYVVLICGVIGWQRISGTTSPSLMLLLLFQKAKSDIQLLHEGLKRVADLSTKVTTHFCEDEKNFRLEDCIGTLLSFCEKIKSCQQASAILLFVSIRAKS